MNRSFLLFLLIYVTVYPAVGQTRAEIEEQRRKNMEEIAYVDKMISSTARQKSTGINELKILGNKINLRESVIKGMGSEIDLLNTRIDLNRLALEIMEEDLILLRKEYANAIINSYKSKKGNPEIVYILSAKDFNQGYKRVKYLQQVSKIRRNEAEIISELIEEIESSKIRLEEDLGRLSDLQHREIIQKSLLKNEQDRKQRLVRSLTAKEKQLQKELEEKKRVARNLEKALARIIEEERKKSSVSTLTPEQKLIGDNFLENRGRLPWPVERGTITAKFGKHQHPVLKYLTEENIGIEISSTGSVMARSVFKGEISAIAAIPGSNMTVIVKHGKYLSVYNNLVNVKVKKGEIVDTKQIIGEVFPDKSNGNICVLKFMIFEGKYLDPELWLAKI
ncbi:MAG TPA: peptidoglycan DD-metalloendopeptidase family protein [Bacteroidales bacterium]|nr:peptidoglycan DD-metalloendopeptidase family protein [Bacteroidales bacterium]